MFETRGTLLSTRVRASSSVRVPSTASRDMTSLSPRRRDARHSTLAQVLERKARKAAQHVVARSGPKGVEDLANFDDEGNEIVDEDAPTSDFAGQVRRVNTHTPDLCHFFNHADAISSHPLSSPPSLSLCACVRACKTLRSSLAPTCSWGFGLPY
mmetsp:Transcript_13699/g.38602  ORF Transcript_13699/g.38602 Transcript_13699/m.38602 type:complete len:155 (-) Transcript_13699:681-1145(-)